MTILPDPARDLPEPRVRVVTRGGEHAVVAAEDLPAGAVLLKVDGPVQPFPTRHSVQVGIDEHVEASGGVDATRDVWCYLNHSCSPNAVLRGRVLVAIRDIRSGEPVTFDYETNEWEMSAPFECRCGSEGCRGTIRGFRYLLPEQRERLRPWLSPHIVAQMQPPDVR